ncbi:prephenate dehydrogenase [Streptosporangium becharense]|uniref:Prephenate dehydrogenase n=1 Tax=Streptosporangium becharense TaxID=1816182 RepID=A0A7W9ICJ7_9ACTN|nr:prephenate dehydrogenase [Streptosporangium becharense]MBB2912966.1 prephenate dehydrogenase [Streptosporangium becharense]MBB5818209.1 prephenate dehydrogenase [Streptosporangium becharense]
MSVLGSVLVVGTGLIGTSVALALREQDVTVHLADRDAGVVRLARELGAGIEWAEGVTVDMAVIAVPPHVVADQLAALQKAGAARFYTDVASVKALPLRRAAHLGCDLTTYVAGHPLAGRERSGPAAARADLFLGRPWALCPTPETSPEALEALHGLVKLCGGEPVTVDAAEHDRAVAVVSHAPHVTASAVAARLADAPGVALSLSGQGVRDVTRIAAGDPALWTGILAGNALPVAEVLEAVADDLAAVAASLRAVADARTGPAGMARVTELLHRGVEGTGRIPGKHGGPARAYAIVQVIIGDRPGELARLFRVADEVGVNIEDVRLEHAPGLPLGAADLSVQPEAAEVLSAALRERGWHLP